MVFAKCLFADADLLMLDEPTRGIDVGAKSEIYGIIRQLSKEGKSIMIFSSELPEVVNICDTIYLLYDGSMKATMRNGCDIDSEKILHIVTGGDVASAVDTATRHRRGNQARAKTMIGGRMSNESFITLFMIGVLVVLFGVACAIVPNSTCPRT